MNPIGIIHSPFTEKAQTPIQSSVHLAAREGNLLKIEGVDMLDGTPLLDIKPYVPDFDIRSGRRAGWYETQGGRVMVR
jgi:tRNA (Thr-GGU) A37 N-methylase